MSKFKWGNHDKVLSFGKKLLNENISKVTTKSPYGDITVRKSIDDGLAIIARLGTKSERDEASNLVTKTLKNLSLNPDLNDWQKSEIQRAWTTFKWHNLERDNGY